MKANFVVLLLALLTFISTVSGGYLYYSNLTSNSVKAFHQNANKKVNEISKHISMHLNYNKNIVKTLAGFQTIREFLISSDNDLKDKVNGYIDNYQKNFKADVCYILDKSGTVVSTSNRHLPSSFLNKQYSFRPYFTEAIGGNPAIYLALGITSGKRGIYYSYPVYGRDQKSAVGVMVTKFSLDEIEEEMKIDSGGFFSLVSLEGIIFASTNPELLFKSLWKISPEVVEKLKLNKQFGLGKFEWSGYSKPLNNLSLDQKGEEYVVYDKEVKGLPRWKLFYYQDQNSFYSQVFTPFYRLAIIIIITFCFFISFLAFFLYRHGKNDLAKSLKMEMERERLIKELETALAEVKTLSDFLPICASCKQIRDDKGYWSQVESYISKHVGTQFSHGICPDCMVKLYPEFIKKD